MNQRIVVLCIIIIICLVTAGCTGKDMFKKKPLDQINKTHDKKVPALNTTKNMCNIEEIKSDYSPFENVLVKNLTLSPDMSLIKSGGEVKLVSTLILTPDSNGNPFGDNQDLNLLTDLEQPRWEYEIVIDKYGTERSVSTNNHLFIQGFRLSVKNKTIIVNVELTGVVPKSGPENGKNSTIIAEMVLDKNDGYLKYDLINVSANFCHLS